MSAWRDRLFQVGVVILVAAFLVTVAPLPDAVSGLVDTLAGADWLVFGLAALGAVAGSLAVLDLDFDVKRSLYGYSSGSGTAGSDRRSPRERLTDAGGTAQVDTAGGTVVGAALDEALDDLRRNQTGTEMSKRLTRKEIRTEIGETAIAVLMEAEDLDRATAIEHIETGSWTEDPRAAAFLSEEREVPPWIRLIDWFSGAAFERQARATIVELTERTVLETAVSHP